MPFRRDGTGWEALEEGQVGLGGPGKVGRPAQRIERIWETRESR